MEVRLYGNLFSYNHEKWQGLAIDNTWLKKFWQYVHHLQIEVSLHEDCHIQPICEGDRFLMEAFILVGYSGKHLVRLNWVRKHKKLLHLSDIIKCDRISVENGFLGDAVGVGGVTQTYLPIGTTNKGRFCSLG